MSGQQEKDSEVEVVENENGNEKEIDANVDEENEDLDEDADHASGYATDKEQKASGGNKGGKNYRPCELLWMCRAWVGATENSELLYSRLKKSDRKQIWLEDLERIYGLLRDEGIRRFASRKRLGGPNEAAKSRLYSAAAAGGADADSDQDNQDEHANGNENIDPTAKLLKEWEDLVQHDYYVSRKGVALNQRWIRYVRKNTFRFMALCELEPQKGETETDDQYFDRVHSKFRQCFPGEDFSDYRPGWEYMKDKRVFLKLYDKQRARVMTEVSEAVGGKNGDPVPVPQSVEEKTTSKRKHLSSDPKIKEMIEYLAKRRRIDSGEYDKVDHSLTMANPLMGGHGSKTGQDSDKYYEVIKTGLEKMVGVCKEALELWQEQQDAKEIRKIDDPFLRKRAETERAKLMIVRMKHNRKRLEAELEAFDASENEGAGENKDDDNFSSDKMATI